MKLTTVILKTGQVPNFYPGLKNLLITFSTTTYVFINEIPDIDYLQRANLIGSGTISIKIPKIICGDNELHFYQASGSDSYVGIVEVE